MITELTDLSENLTLHELFSEMIDKSGYKLALINEGIEGKERIENVEEFASTIMQYEMENEQPSLSAFLEEIALVSDIDSMDNEDDKVVLMTVHSAKGLEFNTVYLIGMEEGIFPGNQSIYGGPEEIEEERRLAYVAITRAKKQLNISNAYTRMIFGTTNRNMASRFLREIPMELCDVTAGSAMRGFTTGTQYSSSSAPTYKTANTYKSSIITQSSSKKPLINYNIGQRVEHKTFGVGTVTAVTPMGNDSMLVIEFDSIGTKKIMAQFANLKVL